MILIGAHQISKNFASKTLFEKLTFSIESGEKIGLIGPNGAGKSTLLKILAGLMDTDGGQLSVSRNLKVGYLEQVPQFKTNSTIQSVLNEQITDLSDWEEISRIQEISSKLNLSIYDPETLVENLSGGTKKRLALARELIKQPDLLLLDEPTNHLDVESILELEELITNSAFAVLTITHDRVFLQKISNRIIELNSRHAGGLLSIRGNYSDFLEARAIQLSNQESQELKLKNTLRRETEWLRRGSIARQTKQQARIDSAYRLADQVDDLSRRNRENTIHLDFQSLEKNPKKLVEAKKVSKAFEGQIVVPPIDLLITPKSRIGLMGRNGCGKTTLIRLLTQTLAPDTGHIETSDRLKVSYFEQNRESLDPNQTVIKTICPHGDHVDFGKQKVHVRSYLSRFLFRPEQFDSPVSKLSGGEQSRLLIAQLMLKEANLLVLDEPTNDLDLATLESLGEVLNEFDGALLLVTHDRYFLDQMTNQILAFGEDENGNKTIDKLVGLDQWIQWHELQLKQKENLKKKKSNAKLEPHKQNKKKLTYKEQIELGEIEDKILKVEARLVELTQKSVDESIRNNLSQLSEVSEALSKTQDEVDRLYSRWAELSKE